MGWQPIPGYWQVWRHGGRVTDRPRLVLKTTDEAKARERYRKIYLALRQGEVRLIDPAGRLVAREWEPCLRTRW